jgi:hypothetical protein
MSRSPFWGLVARIGETLEQAIKRYGEPITLENARGWSCFQKGDFQVNVQFYQGKIDKIEYLKWNARQVVEMSEVEARNFLKANYNGPWTTVARNEWSAPNLLALQNYQIIPEDWSKSYYRLLITTTDAAQRYFDKVAAQETAAQSGF